MNNVLLAIIDVAKELLMAFAGALFGITAEKFQTNGKKSQKNRKKNRMLIAVTSICLVLCMSLGGIGCGFKMTGKADIPDYEYAMFSLPDGSIIEGYISMYEIDGETVRIFMDGEIYRVNSNNVILMTSPVK